MRRYNLTTYHGALPPEAVEFHTSKILIHVWEGAVPEGQGKGGLLYWIIFEGLAWQAAGLEPWQAVVEA